MKDLFRDSEASDELAERFFGRKTGTTGESYGSGYNLERLNSALHKLKFKEYVDVARLKAL